TLLACGSLVVCSLRAAAPTEISTLSLHDALPIYRPPRSDLLGEARIHLHTAGRIAFSEEIEVEALLLEERERRHLGGFDRPEPRSEEHTSELQSRENLVCRLLLEKKNRPTRPPDR